MLFPILQINVSVLTRTISVCLVLLQGVCAVCQWHRSLHEVDLACLEKPAANSDSYDPISSSLSCGYDWASPVARLNNCAVVDGETVAVLSRVLLTKQLLLAFDQRNNTISKFM